MGDELDIHEDRASFPPELDLSPTASLHHHANHYVTRVEIIAGASEQERMIHVYLDLPADSQSYALSVGQWLGEKLARQGRVANAVIESGLNGRLIWKLPVTFHPRTDTTGTRRPLPDAARRKLDDELSERALIDRGELVNRLKTALGEAGRRAHFLEIVDNPGSDLGVVLSWLQKRATARGIPIATVSFAFPTGHSPEDVLMRIARQLVDHSLPTNKYDQATAEGLSVAESMAALAEDLVAHEGGRAVLIFDAIDDTDLVGLRWIDALQSALADAEVRCLGVFVRSRPGQRLLSNTAQRYELGNYSHPQIAGALRSQFGLAETESWITASEIFALSNGEPVRVHAGFVIRRQNCVAWLTR
jgi:hypothetical protein